MTPGWYYGAEGLDRFADLKGTHGGLASGDTLTFFTTTMFAPPAVMRTTDVMPLVNRYFPWDPPIEVPRGEGVHSYFLPRAEFPVRNLP